VAQIEFMVGGELVTADVLKKRAPKAAPRPKTDPQAKWHKGWRVMGHPPGAMENARDIRERELARWSCMTEKAAKEARDRGEREPKPWDESHWRKSAALKAVRSKPYYVPEASEECAELARKAGWLDVVVIEQKKGEFDGGLI
jgi:hypothetical protein